VFNPDSKMIVNLDGMDDLFNGNREEREGEGEGAIDSETDEEIVLEGVIADVTIDPETGAIVVIDENGKEVSYPLETDKETGGKKSVKIVDSQGDTWVVDEKGNVSGSSLKNGSIESRDSEIVNAYSGFDSLVYLVAIQIQKQNRSSLDSIRNKKKGLVREYYISIDDYTGGGLHFLFVGKDEAFIQEGISKTELREPDPFTIIDMPDQDRRKLEPTEQKMLGKWLEIYEQDKILTEFLILDTLLENQFIKASEFENILIEMKERFKNNSYDEDDKIKIRQELYAIIEERRNGK